MRTDLTNRRALLAGLGVAGAGVIAGCSATSSGAGATTSAAPGTAAAVSPSAATSTSSAAVATSPASPAPAATTASAAPTAAASAAPAGFSVPKSKIPVGSGAYFSDDAVIITQPTAGEFKAFTSICTHQGCPVTGFSGAKMICPCHGSEYSITDGSVLQGPAPAPLAAKTITVTSTDVVVAKT